MYAHDILVPPKTLTDPFHFGVSLCFNVFHYSVAIAAEDWKVLGKKKKKIGSTVTNWVKSKALSNI